MLKWVPVTTEEADSGLVKRCFPLSLLNIEDRWNLPIDRYLDLCVAESVEDLDFFEYWGFSRDSCEAQFKSCETVGDLCNLISKNSKKVVIDSDAASLVLDICRHFVGSDANTAPDTYLRDFNVLHILPIATALWRSTRFSAINLTIHRRKTIAEKASVGVSLIAMFSSVVVIILYGGHVRFYSISMLALALVLICGLTHSRPVHSVDIDGCECIGDLIAAMSRWMKQDKSK
jgi:hypothetical protein